MRISTAWIKESLRRTILDNQVVEGLERAGIEIEQFSDSKPIDKKVVIGLVKEVVQHPGADRLKIATVDNGREELRIVCGAPNVRVGLRTPLAQIGAVLPDGTVIAEAKLRGEVSQGMLCSERELGLGESHVGLLELDESLKVGTSLCDVYPSEAWVDVKTPANRFDVLGELGLAREVAAMTDNELTLPPLAKLPGKADPMMVAKLAEGCLRFTAAEISVDPSTETPAWMVARLGVAGIRSLGVVVDITNYVMLEIGQPTHAYDADAITLPFGVRAAKAGEVLKTLDGHDRKLTALDLLVTDAKAAIGLAGVRGGAATEIGPATRRIYLEAASFDGSVVRQSAKRHNLRTDASARFERGIPPQAAIIALQRAIYLLTEHAGAQLVRWSDSGEPTDKATVIKLAAADASRLIGVKQTATKLASSLGRFGIETKVAGETVTATVPWWRPDLVLAEDLIEEVVRVLGYDAIPSTLPAWRPTTVEFDRVRPLLSKLRGTLSGAGWFEVMTYSFVSPQQIAGVELSEKNHLKLQNPLSSEQAYLRTGLLASHLGVAERNRRYSRELAFYELANVFVPKAAGKQPEEPLVLGAFVSRPDGAYMQVKGALDGIAWQFGVTLSVNPTTTKGVLADGRAGDVILDGKTIGEIGQIRPALAQQHKLRGEVAYLELEVAPILAAARPRQYVSPSRFPAVLRDVTVVVPDNITWQAVAEVLADLPHTIVSFGSDYTGAGVPAGHKSLSFHVAVSDPERTPTDAEADDTLAKMLSILGRRFGAKSRD